LSIRARSELLLNGYYLLNGIICLGLSALSPTLWFFSAALALISLASSYGIYSKKDWAWPLSGFSSILGIVFWGTSLYSSWRTAGNPFAEPPPSSADTILIMDIAITLLLLSSVLSLLHSYLERRSFSEGS